MVSKPCEREGGLFEPTAAKPEPLRILKHGKTISNCSISWESEGSNTKFEYLDSDGTNRRDQMSFGDDARLNIRKTRRARGAVTDSLFEPSQSYTSSPYPITGLPKTGPDCDDTDVTPKAKKTSQKARDVESYLESQQPYSHPVSPFSMGDGSPPKMPARRFSLAKSFISKTIGRSGKGLKALNNLSSAYPKKRVYRGSSQHKPRRDGSSNGTSYSIDTSDSFEMQNLSSSDCSMNSMASSTGTEQSSIPRQLSTTASQIAYTLCPKVTVSTEFESAASSSCCIWAGVEISGILQSADGHTGPDTATLRSSLDTSDYGCLYSMSIDLTPGDGCLIEELVGSLYESVSIKLGQARLILVKVRLCNVSSSFPPTKSSPVALIADLENHLGDIVTHFLTVKLTYKHTAFGSHRATNHMDTGSLSQETKLRTIAHAIIKRHDPQSTWHPQSSRCFSSTPGDSPLIRLVESYMPNESAMEAIRRLSGDRGHLRNSDMDSSPPRDCFYNPGDLDLGLSAVDIGSSLASHSTTLRYRTPLIPVSSHISYQRQTDPARRIWSEMRRASRGVCGSPRDDQSSGDEYDACPSPKTTSLVPSDDVKRPMEIVCHKENIPPITSTAQEARDKIKRVALRNQRSIGADTLRSMAPSIVPQTHAKNGSRDALHTTNLGSLGLGISSGRIWGLGMPWW
ncbi:hypothetical protein F5884DRAFT_38038 [Xylogone sp. PMI_703]|nr:hypothetical protein F5884DRAFT_38038 [Xylogone sp. PMI_703]